MIKKLLLAAMALLGAVAAFSQVRVACVGNSITYGYLLADPSTESYPSRLAELLGNQYVVGNFGHSGATLLNHGHNPYMRLKEFRQALDFKPDIALIHLGVNDTDPRNWPNYGDEFVGDYLALIDSLRASNPKVRLLVAKLSPLTPAHGRFKSGTRAWRDSVNIAIEQVALASGAELIDFGAPLIDFPNLIHDAVHPDAEGARRMARYAYSAITGNYDGLKMSPAYGSGMVLQRNKPLVISGTANAGAGISLKLGRQKASAIANHLGRWSVTLPPLSAAEGLTMTVTDGKRTLKFDNVAVGEVWLASGQSNMEFKLRRCSTFGSDTLLADDPGLRLLNFSPRVSTSTADVWSEADKDSLDRLLHFLTPRWEHSTAGSAADFSAVAWHFGRMLRDSLNVPVGIICNAVGGSGAESWVEMDALFHGLPEITVNWKKNDYMQPWVRQRINQDVDRESKRRHPYEPGYLFASGIRPLEAFPIAGVIWYQGESNAHNIEVHEQLFPMLVESWRRQWNDPTLPFLTVQLSSINRPSWPLFRDSQRRLALAMPGVEMAVSSDLGHPTDVHPRDKRPVGQRLARLALHHNYGHTDITPAGPEPVEAKVDKDGKVLVQFRNAEGMHSSDGEPLRTFEVAGPDGVFFPAEATVEGSSVRLNSKAVNPRTVRYGWQPFTTANLVNSHALPASTFRLSIR